MEVDPTKSYFQVTVRERRLILGAPSVCSEQFATFVADAIGGHKDVEGFQPTKPEEGLVANASNSRSYDGPFQIALGKGCELRIEIQFRPETRPDEGSSEVFYLYELMRTWNEKRAAQFAGTK